MPAEDTLSDSDSTLGHDSRRDVPVRFKVAEGWMNEVTAAAANRHMNVNDWLRMYGLEEALRQNAESRQEERDELELRQLRRDVSGGGSRKPRKQGPDLQKRL